jgi:hypothetical protein
VINKILKWHNKGAAIPVYKGSPKADDLVLKMMERERYMKL